MLRRLGGIVMQMWYRLKGRTSPREKDLAESRNLAAVVEELQAHAARKLSLVDRELQVMREDRDALRH